MAPKLTLLLITPDQQHKTKLTDHINKLDLFVIHSVNDSTEAIKKLKNNKYHFIISDIEIGQVDAWCLSSLIRSDIYLSDKSVPIVLLTDTHCEHIAQATAKSFSINAILKKGESTRVNEILADAFAVSLPTSKRTEVLTVINHASTELELASILSSQFDVRNSQTSKLALDEIRQKNVDFVIIDSQLPGKSSADLMNQIEMEKLNIPIVVLVPDKNYDLAEYYMIKGASDFIYYPFNPSRVLNICERAARRKDFMISNIEFATKVEELKNSQQKYRELSLAHTLLLENLSSVVMELDKNGDIRFLNQAWTQLTGFSIEDALGHNIRVFIDFDEFGASVFASQLTELLNAKQTQLTQEVKIKTAQGRSVWVEIKLHQYIRNNKREGLTATIDNIDDRKEAENKLNHIALHDTLTGLYNRYYFDTALTRLAQLAARGNQKHCLLYVDLDHFKIINDTEGHQTGDMVLKEVSLGLSQRLRASDILCRIGGDEFVILLAETPISNAISLGEQICKQIADTHFQFGENSYKVSASIGISEINGSGTASEYLRQADVALYAAKHQGRNGVHIYADSDTEQSKQIVDIKRLNQIQKALKNDDLELHFQPVIDLEKNAIAYFEALVRLNIQGQTIFPDDFIPLLEKQNTISLLDHQVVSKTIYYLHHHPELSQVAINLSAQAFSDEGLLPLIQQKLKEYSVEGDRVIFELTESASLTNVNGTKRMIRQLRKMGCQFSIDDFGTGFSNFAYLKQLPADSIKIDGSFVKDMCESHTDYSLVSAIANVAQSLGKDCVAEFVENEAILNKLKSIGVKFAQGYFISKPLTLEQAVLYSSKKLSFKA